ncbi:MAG: hypothetical protein H0X39_00420 [Actinobacteria bacterium]|nr:hypothetical protein [Actinomycetota bacterium]
MDRIVLTADQQAIVDNYRTANNVQLTDVVVDGTNLVVDDHLQVDNSWTVITLSGDQQGQVISYIPEWGDLILNIDLVDYITDRIGPQGQIMPIHDPVQAQARTAAVAAKAAKNPKHATEPHKESLRRALKEAVEKLPHHEQKHAREVLRDKGVLA